MSAVPVYGLPAMQLPATWTPTGLVVLGVATDRDGERRFFSRCAGRLAFWEELGLLDAEATAVRRLLAALPADAAVEAPDEPAREVPTCDLGIEPRCGRPAHAVFPINVRRDPLVARDPFPSFLVACEAHAAAIGNAFPPSDGGSVDRPIA